MFSSEYEISENSSELWLHGFPGIENEKFSEFSLVIEFQKCSFYFIDWNQPNSAMTRLLAESLPDIHIVFIAFIALLLAAGADLFNPWFVGKIINHILITKDEKAFLYNIAIIAIVSLVSAIATGLRGGLFTLVMARMGLRIRTRLFR